MPALQRKELSVNGRLVSFLVRPAQNASAPALVFLHGWRSEATAWRGVLENLQWPGALYAIDLPGFGASPALGREAGLAEYAAVVEGFIKKNNLRDIIMVGHSFGGRIAIVLAHNQPAWLAKLVLTGAAGVERAFGGNLRRTAVRAAAKAVKPLFSPSFMQPLRRCIYRALGSDDYIATPELAATFQRIIAQDLTPVLKNINVPTLLVWGADDAVTPPAYGTLMERMVPHSSLVVLSQAGHYAFIDAPEEFLQTVHAFIS